MNKTIKNTIYLPFFQGFYCSVHDIEDWSHQTIEDLKEDGKTELEIEKILDTLDYKAYMLDYSKQYVYHFESEYWSLLESYWLASIEFKSLESPQYYNFSNDEININVTFNKSFKAKYLKLRNTQDFQDFIKKKCTSYDGFMSFVDNDNLSNEWNYDNLSANQYTLIIEFILYLDDYNNRRVINKDDTFIKYTCNSDLISNMNWNLASLIEIYEYNYYKYE